MQMPLDYYDKNLSDLDGWRAACGVRYAARQSRIQQTCFYFIEKYYL
jgi:hypothetical protein